MRPLLFWFIVSASGLAAGQEKTPEPNFYSDIPSTKTPAAGAKRESGGSAKKTPVATPAPAKVRTTPKPSSPAKNARSTPGPRIKAGRADPASGQKPQRGKAPVAVAKSGSSGREKFPLDPFQLAQATRRRWDFAHVLPTLQEELSYRTRAALQNVERLSKLLSEFTAAIERRRDNAQAAATATYLLARARVGSPGFAGPDITFPHLAAARATLRHDAGVANEALKNYAPVREALNAKAERARELQTASEKSLPLASDSRQHRLSVTVAYAEEAAARTERMLLERAPPLESLKAVLEAEAFARETQQRESWSSLRPPPPTPELEYTPYVDPDTPMPELTPNLRQRIPEDPKQPLPEPKGLELAAPAAGAQVRAVADGQVVHAGALRGYGHVVIVQHGPELYSVYGYLDELLVHAPQEVSAGTPLARAGKLPQSTASGIYFDVRRGSTSVPPSTLLKESHPELLVFR